MVLSAATWAVAMGIATNAVPKFFCKYVKGAETASDDGKVLWGSVEAMQTMASQA